MNKVGFVSLLCKASKQNFTGQTMKISWKGTELKYSQFFKNHQMSFFLFFFLSFFKDFSFDPSDPHSTDPHTYPWKIECNQVKQNSIGSKFKCNHRFQRWSEIQLATLKSKYKSNPEWMEKTVLSVSPARNLFFSNRHQAAEGDPCLIEEIWLRTNKTRSFSGLIMQVQALALQNRIQIMEFKGPNE